MEQITIYHHYDIGQEGAIISSANLKGMHKYVKIISRRVNVHRNIYYWTEYLIAYLASQQYSFINKYKAYRELCLREDSGIIVL